MRLVVKRTVSALGLILCGVGSPGLAQNLSPSDAKATVPANDTVSLTAHLQLRNEQIEKLDRLYENYAAKRLKAEANLDEWQSELKTAQPPAAFDERKANDLIGDINKALQKVASEFISTRSKALGVLGSVQRSQLEALTSNTRFKISPDRYYQLLLLPVEEVWRLPLDANSERKLLSKRDYENRSNRPAGSGSYGVYGGYGYGRTGYGVYGNYGQGGVGVHAGIGRGGPSIGISIGNIFRLGR